MKKLKTTNIVKIDVIQKYIKDNKLSQKRFSEICGLNIWNLRHVLSGDCHFDARYIFKIAKAMNVKVIDLLND